jgi:hypothetical protein
MLGQLETWIRELSATGFSCVKESLQELFYHKAGLLLFGAIMKKTALALTLMLAFLLLTSVGTLHFKRVHASTDLESIPKPSVPEFTVKLILSPSDMNKTIELKIKNQPFDKNNVYNYSFVYNVRIRTSEENWTDLYDAEDGYPTQSNSDYTVLSYVLGESAYYPPADYPLSPSMKVGILPTSGQVDFQVEAMIGHRDRSWKIFSGTMLLPYAFEGETSGWSSIQTLTISDSPTPTAEPFPTTLVVGSITLVAVIGIGLFVYFKKRKH